MDNNEISKNIPTDPNEQRRILHEQDLKDAAESKEDNPRDFGSIWNNLVIRPLNPKKVETEEKFEKRLVWKNFSFQFVVKSFNDAPYRFKLLIIFMGFILMALCGFLGFSYIGFTAIQNAAKLKPEIVYIQSKEPVDKDPAPLLPPELSIKDKENAISGELFTSSDYDKYSSQRPFLISIDNQADARTQMAGLLSTDSVYEFPVEGGITRFVGVFWSKAPTLIGPIRSVRPYMMDILPEYDAIFSHWGQSGLDPKFLGYLGNDAAGIDSASYYTKYAVKQTECGVYEDKLLTQSGVAIEHSLFVTVPALQGCIPAGWVAKPTIRAYLFKNDLEKDQRPIVSEASIKTGVVVNDVRWVYEPSTNNYTRFVNGKTQQERESGEITTKTIIIQYVSVNQTGDAQRHLNVNIIGTNKATILMDGKVYSTTWKKATRDDRTIFYDSTGAEMRFDRGRIWYHIVPQKNSFIDNQYTIEVK